VHDAASLAAYETCADDAAAGGCEAYTAAAACAETEPEAAAGAAVCLADFPTFYQAVVPWFCGPAEAGSPAAPDGSADAPPD
jgi:hypothetical protein